MVVIYIIYHGEIDDSTAENTLIIILARKRFMVEENNFPLPIDTLVCIHLYILICTIVHDARAFLLFPSVDTYLKYASTLRPIGTS